MSNEVEQKVSQPEAVTMQIKVDDLETMNRLVEEALKPKVTFKEDMNEMREEAARITRQNLKVLRSMITFHLTF
jgi:hypothetical protein